MHFVDSPFVFLHRYVCNSMICETRFSPSSMLGMLLYILMTFEEGVNVGVGDGSSTCIHFSAVPYLGFGSGGAEL